MTVLPATKYLFRRDDKMSSGLRPRWSCRPSAAPACSSWAAAQNLPQYNARCSEDLHRKWLKSGCYFATLHSQVAALTKSACSIALPAMTAASCHWFKRQGQSLD